MLCDFEVAFESACCCGRNSSCVTNKLKSKETKIWSKNFRLQRLEEEVISKRVKLIILDSIASLVRKEFDSRVSRNLTERTALLSKEAAILK